MKTLILNNLQIQQKINRMAYEIYENNYEEKGIILAGIADRGYILAQRIKEAMQGICSIDIELIEVVVNRQNPIEGTVKTVLKDSDLSKKVVIVVDDVLNSGKTLIYGIKHFLNTPVKKISTVVLVDRNHKRFPIKADYVGLSLATTMQEHISAEFSPGNDAVYLD